MKILFQILLSIMTAAASPLAPYTLELDTTKIETIPISVDIDTLLVFPELVGSIIGKGLTTGDNLNGSVLYSQGEINPKTIILRHQDGINEVQMTVMIKDEAFVFRLTPVPAPASVIYLAKAGTPHQRARKLSQEEVLVKRRAISEERKSELLRLGSNSAFFRERIPKMFEDYEEKATDLTTAGVFFESTISRVARFQNEKALLFFGTIHNTTSQPLDLGGFKAILRVGERVLPVSKLRAEERVINPNTSAKFEGLLIGDGQGAALHLSLDNEFGLSIQPAHKQ